jgi:NADH dehydrogenase
MAKSLHIVVLGGTGFVGRALVQALRASGHRIEVLSRNRERHRELLVLPEVRVHSTNVYDEAALVRCFQGADAIVNLVGILQNNGLGGRDFQRAHVELTEIVIAAMRKAGVRRLLQMSSLRAGEGDSHYLRTRGIALERVRASQLDWTVFQPSVIFGPGDGLFCRFAALLKWTPVLPLARADARLQPVWVKDVAQAFVHSLHRPETIGKIYPLVGPRVMTLAEIVRYTARLLGRKRLVLPLPDFIGRLQGLLFDPLPAALKPFSSDNFKSLALDSTSARNGLLELGITPAPVEAIVPDYLTGAGKQRELDRYRAAARR